MDNNHNNNTFMIIAIIGSTGSIGKGFVLQFANTVENTIYVCGRDKDRTAAATEEYKKIVNHPEMLIPVTIQHGIENSDIVILAIPADGLEDIYKLQEFFKLGQIIISPVVDFKNPSIISVAEKIQTRLSFTKVVSAFQNVPAHIMETSEKRPTILVSSDFDDAKKIIIDLINHDTKFYALDAGALKNSRVIEQLTPLLVKIAKLNGLKDLSIKVE